MHSINPDLTSLRVMASKNNLCKNSRITLLEIAMKLCEESGEVSEFNLLNRYICLCEIVDKRSTAKNDLFVKMFINDFCDRSENCVSTRADVIYNAFVKWCVENHVDPLSKSWFGREFGKHFRRKKSNKIMYTGVQLKGATDSLCPAR